MDSFNEKYWNSMMDVVNAWAAYNSVKKLYTNATSPETKHKVQKVVADYYGGQVEKIEDRRFALLTPLDMELAYFKSLCDKAEIELPYTGRKNDDLNWLFNNLKDERDYASFRRKITNRLKRNAPPEPIQNLVRRKKK